MANGVGAMHHPRRMSSGANHSKPMPRHAGGATRPVSTQENPHFEQETQRKTRMPVDTACFCEVLRFLLPLNLP
jgi:hypothetical protein